MSSATTADKHGQIHAIVVAHIEPVTRFDAQHLQEAEAEKVYAIGLTLTLDQQVNLTKIAQSGPGRLPVQTDRFASEMSFQHELDSRLAQANEHVPQAIQNWAQRNQESYRRLMPGVAAFLQEPGLIGYEHQCKTCKGACQVQCTACHGQGSKQCTTCWGSGKVDCHWCNGEGSTKCNACNSGTITEQISTSIWNSSTNSYDTTYHSEQRACSGCTGTGRITCHSCDYNGKKICPQCTGNGRIFCVTCSRTGEVDCTSCNATGMQHVRGTINAAVKHTERLVIETENSELQRLIEAHLKLDELPTYGALNNMCLQAGGSQLRTIHKLHINVTEATLMAENTNFSLYGFGPQCTVFDFKNIAGHLLKSDLHHLEQALAHTSRWRRQREKGLLDATADFLRSELNMLIAEHVPDEGASSDAVNRAVQARFGGLVDTHYISRSTLALRGAVSRVYGAELLEPSASLCALAALSAAVLFGFGWPSYEAWVSILLAIGGSTLAWLMLEWWARHHIAKHFVAGCGKRVVAQLKRNGVVRRWHTRMAFALPTAAIVGVVGAASLPIVQANIQTHRDQINSVRLLEEWFTAPAVDWQQRTYPAHKALLEKAESGNQNAMMVLAWQYLLGTADTTKDVQEAGLWLDKMDQQMAQSNYWKTAKAVQIISQDAMPEDIRKAMRYLAEAAAANTVEAKYWLARIYLAPQSPNHDERQGLKLLTQAADKKHAHAALMLGKKFATGDGLPKNTTKARLYYMTALGGGLTDAASSLNAMQ